MRYGQTPDGMNAGESHHMQSMRSRAGGPPKQKIAIETKIEIVSRNGSTADLVTPGNNTRMVAECYSTDERTPAQGRDMV